MKSLDSIDERRNHAFENMAQDLALAEAAEPIY